MENDPPKPLTKSGRFDNRSGRFSDSGRLLALEEQPDGTGMRWLVGGTMIAGFGIGLYFLLATPDTTDVTKSTTRPSGSAAPMEIVADSAEPGAAGAAGDAEKNLLAWKQLAGAVQATPSPGEKPKRPPAVPAVKDPDYAAIGAGRERADWMYKEQKVFHALPADEQEAVMQKIRSKVHEIEYEPASSSHWIELAKIQADSSMHQAVFNTLYQAYRKFPKDPAVLEARADYHAKWGYRKEAEDMWNELLTVDPANEAAKKGLVSVQRLRYHPIPPVGR